MPPLLPPSVPDTVAPVLSLGMGGGGPISQPRAGYWGGTYPCQSLWGVRLPSQTQAGFTQVSLPSYPWEDKPSLQAGFLMSPVAEWPSFVLFGFGPCPKSYNILGQAEAMLQSAVSLAGGEQPYSS